MHAPACFIIFAFVAMLSRYWPLLGRSWALWGRLRVPLGRSWAALGALGSLVGRSWPLLGRPWTLLIPSWGFHVLILAVLSGQVGGREDRRREMLGGGRRKMSIRAPP